MTLKDKILEDFKQAFKGKDAVKLGALKMLRAELHNTEIAKRKELEEGEIIDVVSREIKKRKDAVFLYEKGNRPELADKEKKEIEILKPYLPEQLSEEEIRNLVKKAIDETGAKEIKEMGKVMGILNPQIKGKADGALVSNIVKECLT